MWEETGERKEEPHDMGKRMKEANEVAERRLRNELQRLG